MAPAQSHVSNPQFPSAAQDDACRQLSLACANVAAMEQPAMPGVLLPDVVPVQILWGYGYLLPPSRPGLGIEFDREVSGSCHTEPARCLTCGGWTAASRTGEHTRYVVLHPLRLSVPVHGSYGKSMLLTLRDSDVY